MLLPRFVCWFVCVLVGLLKTLWMNFVKLLGEFVPSDNKQSI